MGPLLAEALKELNLQPGKTRRIDIDGQRVEIRVIPIEAESSFGDAPMLDLRLNVPPSSNARTVVVSRGQPMLPAPLQVDESDLAPE